MSPLAFTGVVLTGGASSRMGRDKAVLEIDGVAMASLVARALADAGASEVIAVGGDRLALERLAFIDRVVPDETPGEGPLGGILTALDAAREEVVVILACDTPGITGRTPSLLVEALSTHPDAAVAVAVTAGRRQPLTGVWRSSTAASVRSAFEDGERAPRRVLEHLPTIEVDSIPRSGIADVDRPEDLDRYAAGSSSSPVNEVPQ